MIRRAISLAALTLAVASCQTQEERSHHGPPATFVESFEILETRKRGKPTLSPRSNLIDYDSVLTVRPDRVKLARLISLDGATDGRLSRSEIDELDARVRAARERLESTDGLRSIAEQIARYESEALAYFGELEAGTVANADVEYERLLKERAAIIVALRELAKTYVETVVMKRPIQWNPDVDNLPSADESAVIQEANEQHDLVYGRMAPNPNGDRNRYVASEVTDVINELIAVLRGEVEAAEAAILEKAPKATLQITAGVVRGKDERQITISPYQTVENQQRSTKSSRIGIPSDEDIAEVQKGYEAYDRLADAFNEVKVVVRDEAAMKKLRDQFVAELKAATKRLSDRLLKDLQSVIELEDDSLADVQTAASAVVEELRKLKVQLELIDGSQDPIQLVTLTTQILDGLKGGGLIQKVEALQVALAGVGLVDANGTKVLIDRVKASVEAEAGSLAKALAGAPGGGAISDLFRAIKAIQQLANAQGFGDLDTGKITRRPFSLDLAQDGTIDLADSPADDGDRLSIRYELIANPDSEKMDQVRHTASTQLNVRKFGWYTSFEAQLIFFDRLSDGSSSFRAAPGIAYNFHPRPDWWQQFFDVVAPGIGVNVSSPSFDTGADIAVGAQVTLFNNLLQVGYGYNISVEENPEMFFFGFDLISTYQRTQ
ncbi:MAG: hypothetical protein AAGI22_02065 [Planctomycetota bacterium]